MNTTTTTVLFLFCIRIEVLFLVYLEGPEGPFSNSLSHVVPGLLKKGERGKGTQSARTKGKKIHPVVGESTSAQNQYFDSRPRRFPFLSCYRSHHHNFFLTWSLFFALPVASQP